MLHQASAPKLPDAPSSLTKLAVTKARLTRDLQNFDHAVRSEKLIDFIENIRVRYCILQVFALQYKIKIQKCNNLVDPTRRRFRANEDRHDDETKSKR